MLLTAREREELNCAIYEYLQSKQFEKSAEAFLNECPDKVTNKNSTDGALQNILEKKWVTISRLNKKINELELEKEQLNEELKKLSANRKTTANQGDTENMFPRAPPTHTFQQAHMGTVVKVTIHPFYTQIASIGEDQAIKLWDFEAKKYEASLKGHTEKINDISYDPEGNHIASASSDTLIKVWDLNTRSCIKTFTGHDHSVTCIRWKSSGDYLISASRDETIKLWDISTGFCVRTYKGHEKWVRMAIFNWNSTKIASCSDDTTIILWDYNKEAPVQVLYGHTNVIESVIFVNTPEGKKAINESKYNIEGKGIVEDKLSAIELSKKKLADATSGRTEDINALEFLISASRDKTIKIWSGQTGNCLLTLEGHAQWVRGLAMHHSNKFFYSCSEDKSIRVWNLITGKLHSKIEDAHPHFVTDIASHPSYLVCVTASVDSSVKVWTCRD
jgi:platelet-activating factor acetylhydrolase IB subunit alpha